MKKTVRSALALLIAAVLCTALAGCGSNEKVDEKKKEMTFGQTYSCCGGKIEITMIDEILSTYDEASELGDVSGKWIVVRFEVKKSNTVGYDDFTKYASEGNFTYAGVKPSTISPGERMGMDINTGKAYLESAKVYFDVDEDTEIDPDLLEVKEERY